MLVEAGINIIDNPDIEQIQNALECLLYVPDSSLKSRVIQEILKFIKAKQQEPSYKMLPVVAESEGKSAGFVLGMLHPEYKSYSRKSGTFGWLSFTHPKICKFLMERMEQFARENRIRKMRGNVNCPKGLGGLGIQTEGFNQYMLYGVAFNDPSKDYINTLDKLGFKFESEYTCLHVDAKTWKGGRTTHPNIEYRYYSLKETEERILAEAKELGKAAFNQVLPDTTSGDYRWKELFDFHRRFPTKNLKVDVDFTELTDKKEFLEVWETHDLTKINFLMPMAFDKTTGEIVGFLLGIPNFYEEWSGGDIRTVNVDTALVHPDYGGMGIFSGLNNIGQLTASLFGIDRFEGTSVWTSSAKGINNEKAINSIFPHCTPLRKHVVVEKRIKK